MKFEQKKKGNKYTFTLYDDYFNLSYDTQSGSGDKNINYAYFPKKCSIRIEQHEWLKNVGYVWTIAGIYNLGNALYYNAPASGQGIWILSGITCILLAYLSKTKYSVFRTENGIIPIIQDKYHNQIINEINKRKKAQLLEWHREINPDNTFENEIEKFRWLVEEEAMNTREAEEKIQQVKALQMNSFPISSKKLN